MVYYQYFTLHCRPIRLRSDWQYGGIIKFDIFSTAVLIAKVTCDNTQLFLGSEQILYMSFSPKYAKFSL